MKYNYYNEMKNDIMEYLNDYDYSDYVDPNTHTVDNDGLLFSLHDDLWVEDSITGNGSGSYTFSAAIAKEYVEDNLDLLRDAIFEYCINPEDVGNRFINGDYEYFDVSIRCYLLSSVLEDVIDEMF